MGRKKEKTLTRVTVAQEPPRLTPGKVERRELELSELTGLLERALIGPLAKEDVEQLQAAIETLAYLTSALEQKDASLYRLRRLLFGAQTESLGNVKAALGVGGGDTSLAGAGGTSSEEAGPEGGEKKEGSENAPGTSTGKEKKKRKGHGRLAATEYPGAKQIPIEHHDLTPGCQCPKCQEGRLYRVKEPRRLVRVRGMAPLVAEVLEQELLRCNGCGFVFAAPLPEGESAQKYDETVTAMAAVLRYGAGVPFYRLEKLQKSLGMPVPWAAMWELVSSDEALEPLEAVVEALLDEAANGQVLHNDDTSMRVLAKETLPLPAGTKEGERTGVYTSGIVSVGEDHRIALYITGHNHAGENLAEVLSRRKAELDEAIQMCDSLSRNIKGPVKTVLAHCLAHGRRKLIDVSTAFPQESVYLLEKLSEVYEYDKDARNAGMTKEARLAYHQENSAPVMASLHTYIKDALEKHRVEPNSSLGDVFKHLLKHWQPLTLFLRVAGAPLDNTLCERALKRAVLHRKGSLFFKNKNGAEVGDLYMTLIHTAELNDVNPFDWLLAMLRHPLPVKDTPEAWLPWTYRDTLARLSTQA